VKPNSLTYVSAIFRTIAPGAPSHSAKQAGAWIANPMLRLLAACR